MRCGRGTVALPRLGSIRTHEPELKLSRKIDGGTARILSATVLRTALRWFVSFTVDAAYRRGVGFYYDLVKANVERIVKSLSAELEDHPVTAVGVDSGVVALGADAGQIRSDRGELRDACVKTPGFEISESPAYVGRGVAALAWDADAHRSAGAIISARQLADTYGVTDADGSRPDCWGYLAAYGWEQDDGKGIDQFR